MRIFATIAIFATSSFVFASSNSIWGSYENLLSKVVGTIHYKSTVGNFYHTSVRTEDLQQHEPIQSIMKMQLETLKNYTPSQDVHEKLAFWINAYNFFTLVEVKDHPNMKSMKDIGWKNEKFEVAHQMYSLDHIEHKILRPLKDPRIHFAINCASVGCPALAVRPYFAKTIDSVLDKAVQNALRNPLNLRVEKHWWHGDFLNATSLFSWFQEDFEYKPYGSVENYIKKFAPQYKDLASKYKAKIDYNWSLYNEENVRNHMKKLKEKFPELEIREVTSNDAS